MSNDSSILQLDDEAREILRITVEDLVPDATTTKEQPAFQRAQKPLILLAFRHFEGF